MKKNILFIGLCLIITILSCNNKKNSNSKINDFIEVPDTNFKKYLVTNFDTDKDGKISKSEAEAVKVINCSNMNISDMAGIEQFINIEELDCSKNKLIELDVCKNAKLVKLNIKDNEGNPDFNRGCITLYVGRNSPIKNQNMQLKGDGTEVPIDKSKVIYDEDKTIIMLSYTD